MHPSRPRLTVTKQGDLGDLEHGRPPEGRAASQQRRRGRESDPDNRPTRVTKGSLKLGTLQLVSLDARRGGMVLYIDIMSICNGRVVLKL